MSHGGPRKGSGRKAGSPNKATQKQRDEIAASGLTPLAYLLSVLRNEGETEERRMDAAKSAAPYVHPRLASVDMTSKNDNTLRVISDQPQTEDEWTKSIGMGSASGAPEVPH